MSLTDPVRPDPPPPRHGEQAAPGRLSVWAAAAAVRRLYVLLCGFEIIPKTVSTRDIGRASSSPCRSRPICSTPPRAGCCSAALRERNLRDPARLHDLYTSKGWIAAYVVEAEHELARQLAEIGIGFAGIRHVVLATSADHAGHIGTCRRRVSPSSGGSDYGFQRGGPPSFRRTSRFPISTGTLSTAMQRSCPASISSTPAATRRDTSPRWSNCPTPGPVVLAADVGDLMTNFREEILPGRERRRRVRPQHAIRRINRLVGRRAGCPPALTHDPDEVQRIRLALELYA